MTEVWIVLAGILLIGALVAFLNREESADSLRDSQERRRQDIRRDRSRRWE